MTMNRLLKRCTVGMALPLLLAVTGCGRDEAEKGETGPITLRFLFKNAKDLPRGARVMALGTQVGTVIEQPQITPEGDHVTFRATIDRLGPGHRHLLNSYMTAEIKKDDLVTGERILVLHFKDVKDVSDVKLLSDGDTVIGFDSLVKRKYKELFGDGKATEDPGRRVAGLLFQSDPAKIGKGVVIFNSVCLAALIFGVLAMIADGFLRLLRGSDSKRASPWLLLLVWRIFVLCALLVCLLIVTVFIVRLADLAAPEMSNIIIIPDNPVTFLKWYLPFLGVFAVLAILRQKFHLLMRGK